MHCICAGITEIDGGEPRLLTILNSLNSGMMKSWGYSSFVCVLILANDEKYLFHRPKPFIHVLLHSGHD